MIEYKICIDISVCRAQGFRNFLIDKTLKFINFSICPIHQVCLLVNNLLPNHGMELVSNAVHTLSR